MDDENEEYPYVFEDDLNEQVNVYWNPRQRASSSDKNLESILKRSSSIKTVTFAMDDTILDPQGDEAKSKQELLSKISTLTDMLRDAEAQFILEREKRKKKEKNLLKLAKELKKRNLQQEIEKEMIEAVRRKTDFGSGLIDFN